LFVGCDLPARILFTNAAERTEAGTTRMGILYWKDANKQIPLRKRFLLGRNAHCNVRIDSSKISSEHASLHWAHGGWELRDHGSLNGTFLEGECLERGERVMLGSGATFSLSRMAAVFELREASPPYAAAQHRETGAWLIAEDGLLALPSADKPHAIIFTNANGVWQIEVDDQVRYAIDQDVLMINGDSFFLEIPSDDQGTMPSDTHAPTIASIRLRFVITPDEETVDTTVFIADRPHRLEPRRYHYLLATLARTWLSEHNVTSSLRGWMDRDELCQKLEMDVGKLNVEIYRARKQLAEYGVLGAAQLIERRPGTHQLRIGVTNVEVVRA